MGVLDMIVLQIVLGILFLTGTAILWRGMYKMQSPKFPAKLNSDGSPSIWMPGVGQMFGGFFLLAIAGGMLAKSFSGS